MITYRVSLTSLGLFVLVGTGECGKGVFFKDVDCEIRITTV